MLNLRLNSFRLVSSKTSYTTFALKISLWYYYNDHKFYLLPKSDIAENKLDSTYQKIKKLLNVKNHNILAYVKMDHNTSVIDLEDNQCFESYFPSDPYFIFIKCKILFMNDESVNSNIIKQEKIICLMNKSMKSLIPFIYEMDPFCAVYAVISLSQESNQQIQMFSDFPKIGFVESKDSLSLQDKSKSDPHKKVIEYPQKFHFDFLKVVEYYNTNLLSFFITSTKINNEKFFENVPAQSNYLVIYQQKRKNEFYKVFPLNSFDYSYFKNPQNVPMGFEETLINNVISNNHFEQQNKQLFIFAHGFNGDKTNLSQLQKYLKLIFPNSLFLLSSSNESNTKVSLKIMGENLVKEIFEFIENTKCENEIKGINFIGHSLGGLIIRCALPYLSKFKDKMNTYASLSTHHFGFNFASKISTTIAINVINSFTSIASLNEANMNEATDLRNTLLYQLAFKEGFEWFNNFIFVSAEDDTLCPNESARLEITQKALNQNNGELDKYLEMVNGLKSKLIKKNIFRFHVIFQKSNEYNMFDNLSGSYAHKELICNDIFSRMFAFRYWPLFN